VAAARPPLLFGVGVGRGGEVERWRGGEVERGGEEKFMSWLSPLLKLVMVMVMVMGG